MGFKALSGDDLVADGSIFEFRVASLKVFEPYLGMSAHHFQVCSECLGTVEH